MTSEYKLFEPHVREVQVEFSPGFQKNGRISLENMIQRRSTNPRSVQKTRGAVIVPHEMSRAAPNLDL